MNRKVLTVLEYKKIIERMKTHIVSDIGREGADALYPVSSLAVAKTLLDQTEQAESVYVRLGHSPVMEFPDIRDGLMKIHAVHAFDCAELLACARCLEACRRAREAILENSENPGTLTEMAERLPSQHRIEEEICRCIVSEDEIADNASPALAHIRRQIRIMNERMRDKLNDMIKSPTYAKYVQEPIITVRNGHYAIPFKAEYRAQISGIIHDASGSGATVFVEPAVAVEIGNEIRRLEGEERAEIGRILSGLTALVEPVSPELISGIRILGTLDLLFAKAALARELHAVLPKLNDSGYIRIVRGRHPLLDPDTVVPTDFVIGTDYSTLIVTGPNTGGKTVTLKTVGLLSLMAASGLFVPADIGTELCVFREIFADIGDEQSIEQSLSTFSSHMRSIVEILKQAGPDSLILLDELGAGTDPTEGAALAQAILERLFNDKATVIATTHYSEIKAFALTHPGMTNASMEFDVEKLRPTYKLLIGIPGRSNAFEISEKLGLESSVIEAARGFLKARDISFEDILSRADKKRREAEAAAEAAETERIQTEAALQKAEKLREQLEADKVRIREKAKEESRRLVSETKEEMEQLIRDLRQLPNMDQRALERAIQASRDALKKRSESLYTEEKPTGNEEGMLDSVTVGQTVRLATVGKDAVVLKEPDAKNEVLIQAGIVKMKVPITDLRAVAEKKPARQQKTAVKLQMHDEGRSFLELDLRGKMVDEAEIEIDRFIDDASLHGIKELTLIHGKGTGALRVGVQQYLRANPYVKSFRIGTFGEGDAGVTVVTLK